MQLWQGELQRDQAGSFALRLNDGATWPLIILESSVQDWLKNAERLQRVQVMGHRNPWGRWLRVSRVVNVGEQRSGP